MDFEIKYESTGGIYTDNGMRNYQYCGYEQNEDYSPGDVNTPDSTTAPYFNDNARGMFQRDFYQPYHVNQAFL
uniref:Uncharacterized protein n=1 Tax=Strongyloides papillosus TaxID=174720 RepID=A0A0N5B4L3_STREA